MAKIKTYPSSKEILFLIGVGVLIPASFLMPGLGRLAKDINKLKFKSDIKNRQKSFEKFNLKLLRRNLKRLEDQKVIDILNYGDETVIKLTTKGRSKYLKFKLEDLSLKGKGWDGKWRVILYDVGSLKKKQQEEFRRILKRINFLPLQKSVYLTPYKCQDEIEYLREYFNLGKEVIYLEISRLENENQYKKYFGL